jgi:hypothetical protein
MKTIEIRATMLANTKHHTEVQRYLHEVTGKTRAEGV